MKKSLASLLLVVLATILLLRLAGAQERFDHETHANLFPMCISCHEGAENGKLADMYPASESCASCHDGKTADKVDWRAPARLANNLNFQHKQHVEDSGEADCASCHAKVRGAKRMSVARAKAETCIACHSSDKKASGPVVHFEQTNKCSTCHISLKDARGLTQAQIAAFPEPASHKSAEFIREHARTSTQDAQSCATCHTRESCSRCHANAQDVKVIASLGSNELVGAIVSRKQPVYPTPADHRKAGFSDKHGMLAEARIESCSNCHTRAGCQQCHAGSSAADRIAALPQSNTAPGVNLAARTRRAHPEGFGAAHGNTAGASGESCTSCHAQKFCSDCHQGGDSRKFHPSNFAARHAQAVYANDTDCASCHNRESFCQSCHNGLGLSANGQRPTQFHNGQTIWLLQHGQPARQNLESCTSCHTQSSCTRCHSNKGGWGVSPHGSNIPTGRLADKNRPACLRCHFSNALKR